MIGYMQSDAAGYWHAELQRRFNEDTDGELRIRQGLEIETTVETFTNEWTSIHGRTTANDIRIYHIFLDCI